MSGEAKFDPINALDYGTYDAVSPHAVFVCNRRRRPRFEWLRNRAAQLNLGLLSLGPPERERQRRGQRHLEELPESLRGGRSSTMLRSR